MNKAEMADGLVARTGLGNVAARDAVDSVLEIIGETLAGGEEVRIGGIGDLRHWKQIGPYRTEPQDRGGRSDTGVGVADVQGGEDAERNREWRVQGHDCHAADRDSGRHKPHGYGFQPIAMR